MILHARRGFRLQVVLTMQSRFALSLYDDLAHCEGSKYVVHYLILVLCHHLERRLHPS